MSGWDAHEMDHCTIGWTDLIPIDIYLCMFPDISSWDDRYCFSSSGVTPETQLVRLNLPLRNFTQLCQKNLQNCFWRCQNTFFSVLLLLSIHYTVTTAQLKRLYHPWKLLAVGSFWCISRIQWQNHTLDCTLQGTHWNALRFQIKEMHYTWDLRKSSNLYL